jgi:hypothetical protein
MNTATNDERPTRYVVEARVADLWRPVVVGSHALERLVRRVARRPPRLMVYGDERTALAWAAIMNTRRGSMVYRVTPTRATDAEILREVRL